MRSWPASACHSAVWWFVVRPWRRERRITLDGMLRIVRPDVLQDPLLNYLNTWCTYNTWNIQHGCLVIGNSGVAVSPEVPGHQTAEPLLTEHAGLFLEPSVHHNGMFVRRSCGVWKPRPSGATYPDISKPGAHPEIPEEVTVHRAQVVQHRAPAKATSGTDADAPIPSRGSGATAATV